MPRPAAGTESSIVRFGVFQFHPGTLELARQGVGLRLQTQPARLLGLLLARAGELVSRETIRASLWPDGTIVDFEPGVNRCVRQLRAVLGDDMNAPRYIKTIPRLGYCFIAAVAAGPAASAPATRAAGDSSAIRTYPSVAVLPFANLSGDPQDEYFSDGLSEEITNALAQIAGLKIIARSSAFCFKGKYEDIRKIGETLGANHVLEGSVRRSGALIRVTVQLIQAADGVHRLSKRYDREITDIFALQDEISADVAQQLRVHLVIARHSTRSHAAYEAYLEGRFHWHKYAPAEFEKGLNCFERAVDIDSAYAGAYTGIAQCCLGMVTEGGLPALEFLPKAAAAARRALELDDTDAEAHAALGQVAVMLDYDWLSAERHFRRALVLNPLPYVGVAYAIWCLLPQVRIGEAREQSDRVVEQEPLYLVGRVVRAVAMLFARDYEAAAECCLRLLEIDGRFAKAVQMLAVIRGVQGRSEETLFWAERLVEILGRSRASLCTLAMAYARAGKPEAAREVLREAESFPGTARGYLARIGLVYGMLGEVDLAFEWLEEAIRKRDPQVLWMGGQPSMDCLHGDPRFRTTLKKLKLPTVANQALSDV